MMYEFKMPLAEGASSNRPPMFGGVNYAFLKIRMKIFMESIDMGIWDAVVSGPFIPMQVVKEETIKKPWSEWSETQRNNKETKQIFLQRNCIILIFHCE